MTYLQEQHKKPVTLTELARMREQGEKIAVLTCYDASFAAVLERCGVDVMLVGDSLGNVLQGHATTLPVTLEHMSYHTACVARGLGKQGGRSSSPTCRGAPIRKAASRPCAAPCS